MCVMFVSRIVAVLFASTDCGWCASGHSFSMLNTNSLIAYEGCVIVELCVCMCICFDHAVAGWGRLNRLYCPQSVILVLAPSASSSVAASWFFFFLSVSFSSHWITDTVLFSLVLFFYSASIMFGLTSTLLFVTLAQNTVFKFLSFDDEPLICFIRASSVLTVSAIKMLQIPSSQSLALFCISLLYLDC